MKKQFTYKSIINVIFLLLFFIIVVAPVLTLLYSAFSAVLSGDIASLRLIIPEGRRMDLLLKSVEFAAFVAMGASFTGVFAGSLLYGWRTKTAGMLKNIILLLAIIPNYIHTLAWSSAIQALNTLLKNISPGFHSIPLDGMSISIWVQMMCLLPFTVGLTIIGFEIVDGTLVDSARVLRKDLQVFFKIILPLAVPAIIAGSTFVFMISLMDYSVPSIFQVNLYSLDIFANFSSDYNIAHALFLAIPLLIIAIVAASVFQSSFRSIALSSGSTKQCTKSLSFPVWFRILQWIAFIIVFLQIAIPVISLIFAAGSPTAIIQSFTGSMREMGYTILISFVAALFSVPFSICAATQINKQGYMKNIWWFMLIIPLTMPPPLIGIGLISLWNSFPGIYGTLIMPVIAGFIRFIPFATIITLAQMKRIDPQLIQAASILQKNPFQTLLKVRLPLLSRGILAAMCVMFILTSGELGATLLVAPPGKGTLTMKIYNYLHYGQSGTVAGLCLLMLVFSLIIGVLLYKLFIRRR